MKKLIKSIIRYISIGDNWGKALAIAAQWTFGTIVVYSVTESFWLSLVLAPLGFVGALALMIIAAMPIACIIYVMISCAKLLHLIWKRLRTWAYKD